jgi:hypothetical protein
LTRFGNLQQGHASTQGKFGSLDGVRKTFDKHPLTYSRDCLSPVLLMINRALNLLRQSRSSQIKTAAQRFEGGWITRITRFIERLTPGHLLNQKRGGHRRVGLGVDWVPMPLAKQSGSLDRIAQHSHRLIGRGRPLNCDPKIAIRCGRMTVGMHDALHLSIR